MAEAVAALYAVETALEGAALGAFAVSRPTAPLRLSFRKVSSPVRNHEQARSGHTFNIVKGNAYIVGGQSDDDFNSGSNGLQTDQNRDNNAILALTLPVASSTGGEGSLTPRDHEIITPEYKDASRPLALQVEAKSGDDTRPQALVFNRVGHTTTAIGDKLYIWGGEAGKTSRSTSDPSAKNEAGQFVVFDPLTSSYDFVKVDTSNCRDGIPSPRSNHAATSSPRPQPNSLPDGPTVDGHGTIFIHGGTSSEERNGTLRDTWAFDVGTGVWTRLPDIPNPGPSEVANEGRLAYVNGRLWRLGDGFGRAMYLDLSDDFPREAGFHEWQVINFGTEATDHDGTIPGPNPTPSTTGATSLPMPRLSATVLPLTTGSGRQYLLYFMGQGLKTGVLNDFWSFQIHSEENTASSVKDTIRDAVAKKTKKSWSSGKFSWARCEIQAEKGGEDGDGTGATDKKGKCDNEKSSAAWLEGEGLYSFASDVWTDQGGNVFVIWGGKRAEGAGAIDEGWVVTVE